MTSVPQAPHLCTSATVRSHSGHTHSRQYSIPAHDQLGYDLPFLSAVYPVQGKECETPAASPNFLDLRQPRNEYVRNSERLYQFQCLSHDCSRAPARKHHGLCFGARTNHQSGKSPVTDGQGYQTLNASGVAA